jgi:hypothetical protein
MKLGGKSKDVDSFVDMLKSEGENVASESLNTRSSLASSKQASKVAASQPQIKTERYFWQKSGTNIQITYKLIFIFCSVHCKLEEKMTVVARRDGGLENMELLGMLTLRISDEPFGRIKLQIKNASNSFVQLQTHPNIDKELLKTKTQIALKNPAKPFPLNTDVGVLKWRLQTTDEANIPLSSKYILHHSSSNIHIYVLYIYSTYICFK